MIYILYNPLSGNSDTEAKLAKITDKYPDNSKIMDITAITSYADFLSTLSEDDIIVIGGGDGTLNRFVNDTGELEIKNEIYYLALGTGNDFLKDIAEDTASGVCITKYLKNLPTVTVNGKSYKFINNVGFGIDGYCCEVGDQKKARGETDINYSAIAIKGLLFFHKPSNARVTVDGVTHEYKKVWIAPTMNGRYYGGGMMPTPNQDRLSADGTLSVMIWHGSGKLKTLTSFPSLFKGEHITKTDMIEILVGHEITVEFDRPCALQIDGETILGVTSYSAQKHPVREEINA